MRTTIRGPYEAAKAKLLSQYGLTQEDDQHLRHLPYTVLRVSTLPHKKGKGVLSVVADGRLYNLKISADVFEVWEVLAHGPRLICTCPLRILPFWLDTYA